MDRDQTLIDTDADRKETVDTNTASTARAANNTGVVDLTGVSAPTEGDNNEE